MSWTTKMLGDVVRLRRGYDLPTSERQDGPYPVLSAGHAIGSHIVPKVPGPGFAVGRATNLGRPVWSDTDFWPLNTTLYAEDFLGNEARWVYHLFETLDLSGYNSGSAQPMLNRNYIAKVPVLVPPLRVQQAIAEVLGALDDKIAVNAQALEVSDSLVRVLYSQLSLSPRTLGEIAHSARDFVSSGAETPGESYVALEHFDKRQMWLRRHADAAVATSTKTRFLPGDTLFGKLRPYFHKVARASMSGICSTDILVVRPNSKSDTALVLAAASSDAVVEAAVMSSNGTRMPRAQWQDIASCRVPDPTDPQVRCFVQSVDAITARMDRATEENTTLTAVRDELLPQLMSGRITVKDAEKRVEEEV